MTFDAMERRDVFALMTALGALAVGKVAEAAEPQSATGSFRADWDNLIVTLRDLPDAVFAKLPKAWHGDSRIQQEVGRLSLEALASSLLSVLTVDGDHPEFVAASNNILQGQPNADTVYKTANITAGGVYRLRGKAGSAKIAKIGAFAPKALVLGKVPALAYYDLNKLPADADGNFDVILSPARPDGYAGAWWQLDPTANFLFYRSVAYDWNHTRDAAVSIERLDVPPFRPRPAEADVAQSLRLLPNVVKTNATILAGTVTSVFAQGYVNGKVQEWDLSKVGGLAGQTYYQAGFDLKEGEALFLEVTLPTHFDYASLLLTNGIFETIDWVNNHSSLNATQWKPDADGKLRVVVSATDPGVPNWLDTAGYPTGIVQGRWTNASSNPLPDVRKIAFADVGKFIAPGTPAVSPAERAQNVRDRRSAYQLRRFW